MNKKLISLIVLSVLLIGGSAALAQGNNVANNQATIGQQEEVQDPSYNGSITVSGTNYDGQSEQNESTALAGLAKITADQAKKIAETKIGGTASSIQLGNENGNLVYEVTIGTQTVKVDAGNGNILHMEKVGDEKEEVKGEGDNKEIENEKEAKED